MFKKIGIFLTLALVLVVGVGYWFYENVKPVSGDSTPYDFVIPKGSSAMQIGNKLYSAKMIKNPLAYKIYVQVSGKSGKIGSGEYRVSPNMNLFEIVDRLTKGPIELWVTIPEGLRHEEIAQRFANGLSKDSEFVSEFESLAKGKEGMLFPETYLFPKDATAGAIIKKLTSTYNSKIADLKGDASHTPYERLILASIIERETKTDEERPMVAGILINRLKAGMPLQVDASVQYAVGTSKNWWPILTRDDLSVSSPYNTYKYQGLPPAPIANPGLSSITASYNPTPNDYWYYIHDTKGQIHYAKTLEEHNANIRKYLGK